jgi:hemoglobin-like flavoprotein
VTPRQRMLVQTTFAQVEPIAETAAAALIRTLEAGLGDAFTREVREAWATVYWLLADAMKDGAPKPPARTA